MIPEKDLVVLICFIIFAVVTLLVYVKIILKIQNKMRTLQVNDNDAREIYKTATPEMKKVLEGSFPKGFFSDKLSDRIKLWEDIEAELGKANCKLPYSSPSNKLERSVNAGFKIQKMTELFNQGVKLDWTNQRQSKYFIWWERKSSGWVVGGVVVDFCYIAALGSGFYFVNKSDAQYCSQQFLDIFLDYLPE